MKSNSIGRVQIVGCALSAFAFLVVAGCEDRSSEAQSGTGSDVPMYIGQGGTIIFTFQQRGGTAVRSGTKVYYSTTYNYPATGRHDGGPKYRVNKWTWSGYSSGQGYGTLTMYFDGGREVYKVYGNGTFRYDGYPAGAPKGWASGPWREISTHI